MPTIHQENETMLRAVSDFLCSNPRVITTEALQSMTDLGLTTEQGYIQLLAAWLEVDSSLWRRYLPQMVRRLDTDEYRADPCMQAISRAAGVQDGVVLCEDSYAPCELFVADDFVTAADGRVYPQLGWFRESFAFPALMENGRIWMTVTPNEINTIRPVAERMHGKTLAYGLGLGYFAFHALLNPSVDSVTVVERNPRVIRLFRDQLLPRFPRPERLRIIEADAFDYAVSVLPKECYDCVFADLWHDVGDGLPMYQRLKALEVPGPAYHYWIEKTMQAYLTD